MTRKFQIEVFPNHTQATEPDKVHGRAIPTYRIGAEAVFYILRNHNTKMTAERRRAAEYACLICAQDNHMAVSQMRRYKPAKKRDCVKCKANDPRNHMERLL